MHCANIGKSAACVAYRKPFTGISLEKEQACIFLCRISSLFFIGIDIIENCIAVFSVVFHIVRNLNGLIRVNIVVPDKSELPQCIDAVIPVIYRKNQSTIVRKDGIVYHIGYFGVYRILFFVISIFLHRCFCSFEICICIGVIHFSTAPCEENGYTD